jgi:hypothetical protein
VGGYGESPYLKKVLREAYASWDIQVVISDEPSKKAVAEGSVIWFVRRLVVARSVRTTYGISLVYPFNRDNDEHVSPLYGASRSRPSALLVSTLDTI